MKSRCSFILKSALSLALALILLFGTMTVGLAAIIEDAAATGAKAEVAATGTGTKTLYLMWPSTWGFNTLQINVWGGTNGGLKDVTDTGLTITANSTTCTVYSVNISDDNTNYEVYVKWGDNSENYYGKLTSGTSNVNAVYIYNSGGSNQASWGTYVTPSTASLAGEGGAAGAYADGTSYVTLSPSISNDTINTISGTTTYSVTSYNGESATANTDYRITDGKFYPLKSGVFKIKTTVTYCPSDCTSATTTATSDAESFYGYIPNSIDLFINKGSDAGTVWGAYLFNDKDDPSAIVKNASTCYTGSQYYKIQTPATGKYINIIWLKLNSAATEDSTSWPDGKVNTQSADLFYEGKNCFTPTDISNKFAGTWSDHVHKIYAYKSVSVDNGSTYTDDKSTNIIANGLEDSCGTATHQLTAPAADTGYTFLGWYKNSAGEGTVGTGTAATTQVGAVATYSLPVNGAVDSYYYAKYKLNYYTLTFSQTGTTGTVTDTPASETYYAARAVSNGQQISYGTHTISVAAPVGYVVSSYQIDSNSSVTVNEPSTSIAMTVTDNTSLTINYAVSNKTLTVYTYVKSHDATDYTAVSTSSVEEITATYSASTYTTENGTVSIPRGATSVALTDPTPSDATYEFVGFYSEGTDNGSGVYTFDNAHKITSVDMTNDVTVYAVYDRYYNLTVTNGTENGTLSVSEPLKVWYDDAPTSFTVTAADGYDFNETGSTNLSTFYTCSTVGKVTTMTGIPTATIDTSRGDATITIAYAPMVYNINVGAKGKETGSGTFAAGTDLGYSTITVKYGDETQTKAASYSSIAYNTTVTLTADPTKTVSSDTYYFLGWVIENDNDGTLANDFNYTTFAAPEAIDNVTVADNVITITTVALLNRYYNIRALYAKMYGVSAFKSYLETSPNYFEMYTTPPRTIALTHANGKTDTYTYDAEYDQTYQADGLTVNNPGRVVGFSYGNAAVIPALAGDTVVMTYTALPGKDGIKGVFYNNVDTYYDPPVPGHYHALDYTYTSPASNKGALFADKRYYDNPSAEYTAIESNSVAYPATVDQDERSVTFTIENTGYKNIMLEYATKNRVYFVSTTGAKIVSETFNNYYLPEATVGALSGEGDARKATFGVKAATSSKASYTLTPEDVKFYSSSACTPETEITDLHLLKDDNEDYVVDSDGYYPIVGTMPNSDVYVVLDIATEYTVHMSTRMVSDKILNYTNWANVANVTISNGTTTKTSDASKDETKPENYDSVSVASGSAVTLTWDWKDSSSANDYTFVGWFTGDETGPDYINGQLKNIPLTNGVGQSYIPSKNTYIYAVGTRNLYINGSKFITGKSTDWYEESGTRTNLKMEFDPNYINPDGGGAGRYYWEISQDMLDAAIAAVRAEVPAVDGHYEGFYVKGNSSGRGKNNSWSENHYTYDNSGTDYGNGFFQFFDSSTGYDRTIWSAESMTDFYNESELDIVFAKLYPSNYDSNMYYCRLDGLGFIVFNNTQCSSQYTNYQAPITIYAYPGKGFSVSATPKHASIYVSDGYRNLGTVQADKDGVDSTTDDIHSYDTTTMVYIQDTVSSAEGWYSYPSDGFAGTTKINYSGNGWNPGREGHVSHIRMTDEGFTLKISKTVDNAYKVSDFMIYNVSTDTVYSITAKAEETLPTTVYYSNSGGAKTYQSFGTPTGSVTEYTATITMSDTDEDGMEDDLYIIPIIEDAAATLTIEFDAKDMNTDKWGDFVALYAWYDEADKYANGNYPGQMMIYNSETKKWTANIVPSYGTGAGKHELSGILFSNYYDPSEDDTTTWLNKVAGTNIIPTYNSINAGNKYAKSNFKAQTYDYEEPIMIYKANSDSTSISFALKDGNSSDVISLRHKELTSSIYNTTENIFGISPSSGLTHTDSSGGSPTIKLDPSEQFEFLTDSTGNYCVDLNGVRLASTPSPTYYIVAKGMATYSSGTLQKVFYSDNHYDLYTDATYGYDVTYTGANLTNAVQWYVYDSNGTFVTSMMSAGFTDNSSTPGRSKISQAIYEARGDDPSGKSVMICYDVPRYCYNDNNTGSSFDTYRFSGQWYSTLDVTNVVIDVKVGYYTYNKFAFSDMNETNYGKATAKYVRSRGNSSFFSYVSPGMELPFESITLAANDLSTSPIELNAVDDRLGDFVGWFTYNESSDSLTQVSTEMTGFYPSLSGDTTYYAIYNIPVTYTFNYSGRGSISLDKSITVDAPTGIYEAEVLSGGTLNKATRLSDVMSAFTTLGGDHVFDVYGKTLTISDNIEDWDNSRPYKISVNVSSSASKAHLTVYAYSGGSLVQHTFPGSKNYIELDYNTPIDLTSLNGGAQLNRNGPSGTVFIGWKRYDGTNFHGEILSTQANYGYCITRDMTIAPYFGTQAELNTLRASGWQSRIERNEITKEMTSSSVGTIYNDTLVGFRNGGSMTEPFDYTTNECGVVLIIQSAASALSNTSISDFDDDTVKKYVRYLAGNGVTVGKLKSTTYGDNSYALRIRANSLSSMNRVNIHQALDYAIFNGADYKVIAYTKIGSGDSAQYTYSSVASGTCTAGSVVYSNDD